MKRILTLLLLCFSAFNVLSAQTAVERAKPIPDARLFDVFERAYVERLVTEDPFTVERWNFYLDNAFYIDDVSDGKGTDIDFSHYPSIEIADLKHINIFKLEQSLNIHALPNLENIYHIAGTNKILVYKRIKDFNRELNSKLGRAY